MTYDECKELLVTLMEAVAKQIDARMPNAVKTEVGVVRYIDDNNNVYVRPSSDVSTPAYIAPTGVDQLDDGDIVMPNISTCRIEIGDVVEIHYATSLDNAVIVRKIPYTLDTDHLIIYSDRNGDANIPSPLRLSGAIYTSGHSTAVGYVESAVLSSEKDIVSGAPVNVTSISLNAGTWVIVGKVRFSSNAIGFRRANIMTTNESANAHVQIPAVDGAVTQLTLTKIVCPEVTTTYYLNAYQNSGSTLKLGAGGDGEINAMTAIRIA